MKAVLARRFGPPESLVVEEVASPEPGPGQAVVSVHASAAITMYAQLLSSVSTGMRIAPTPCLS